MNFMFQNLGPYTYIIKYIFEYLDSFHDYYNVWNFCGHVMEKDKI